MPILAGSFAPRKAAPRFGRWPRLARRVVRPFAVAILLRQGKRGIEILARLLDLALALQREAPIRPSGRVVLVEPDRFIEVRYGAVVFALVEPDDTP